MVEGAFALVLVEDGRGPVTETRDSRTRIYQPQQSVLYPQEGQRQTACMRYISAPQRSQRVLSGTGVAGEFTEVIGLAGGRGGTASDTAVIIAQRFSGTPLRQGIGVSRKSLWKGEIGSDSSVLMYVQIVLL